MSSLLRCEDNHIFEACFDTEKELVRRLLMQELSCPVCASRKLKQTHSTGGILSLTESLTKRTPIPASLRSALERIMQDVRQKLDAAKNSQSDDEGIPYFESPHDDAGKQ